MADVNPYTAADLKKINATLYDLNAMNAFFDKCDACGMDMTEGKIHRENLYNTLLNIKQTFFTGSK